MKRFEFEVETKSIPYDRLISKLRVSVPIDYVIVWERHGDKTQSGVSLVGSEVEWIANESYDNINNRLINESLN